MRTKMRIMKRTMQILYKCLMDYQMNVHFCSSLIPHLYVKLLHEQILRLSSYLSVELLLYASIMLKKKEGQEKMTNVLEN